MTDVIPKDRGRSQNSRRAYVAAVICCTQNRPAATRAGGKASGFWGSEFSRSLSKSFISPGESSPERANSINVFQMPRFYNLIKNLLQVNFVFAHFIYKCKYDVILMMELFNQRRCYRRPRAQAGSGAVSEPGREARLLPAAEGTVLLAARTRESGGHEGEGSNRTHIKHPLGLGHTARPLP